MTPDENKVVELRQPPPDLPDVYLGYVDIFPTMEASDPRLREIFEIMSEAERQRVVEELRAGAAVKLRRARALELWRSRK